MKTRIGTTRNIIFSCIIIITMLSGCVEYSNIQSLYPFYTEDCITNFPGMRGAWLLQSLGTETLHDDKTLWKVEGCEILLCDTTITSELFAFCFNVSSNMFLNCYPGRIKNVKINTVYSTGILPVYFLHKIVYDDETLQLIPINTSWINDMIESNQLALSYIYQDYGPPLFVTSPEEWLEFLDQYGSDTNVFNAKYALQFDRYESE